MADINPFETYFMVLSQKLDSKVLKIAVSESIVMKKSKMSTELVHLFDLFFEMSFDTPVSKVFVFASDLDL